jgi:predicted phosphodiesterase
LFPHRVADEIIRIISDVHYGDRASLVTRFAQLGPLFAGASRVIFNGDTLDTREGPFPAHTAACRDEVLSFVGRTGVPTTFHTGNHDPDFSTNHWTHLVEPRVFVVHGDVLFDDIVPWGQDAPLIRDRLRHALRGLGVATPTDIPLATRMAIWREVARSIPQRHQSERNPFKYAWHFLADTVWPPTRFGAIFGAWRHEPRLATELLARERIPARFVVLGHTHRPAIQRVRDTLVFNTGSFTAPFGARTVEIGRDSIRVRRVRRRRGEFYADQTIAEFPLANA